MMSRKPRQVCYSCRLILTTVVTVSDSHFCFSVANYLISLPHFAMWFRSFWNISSSSYLSRLISDLTFLFSSKSPYASYRIVYVLLKMFIFRERGKERERKKWRETLMWGEKHWLLCPCIPTMDQTHKPGMCPDLKLNLQPFTLQDDAQPTDPHRSGMYMCFLFFCWYS